MIVVRRSELAFHNDNPIVVGAEQEIEFIPTHPMLSFDEFKAESQLILEDIKALAQPGVEVGFFSRPNRTGGKPFESGHTPMMRSGDRDRRSSAFLSHDHPAYPRRLPGPQGPMPTFITEHKAHCLVVVATSITSLGSRENVIAC
jgi:hypothetical protein